ELLPKQPIAPNLAIGILEFVQGRHEGLGDVPAAEFAEVAVSIGKSSHPRLTRSKSRATLSWSLMPGSASTPLARSMASGRTSEMAAMTLSGVIPPDRKNGFERS